VPVSPTEVAVRLDSPSAMFTVERPDYFSDAATLVPGIDQIVSQLRTRRLDDGVRATVELPAADAGPEAADEMTAAITRYCRARLGVLDDQLRAVRHEGVRALAIGLVLLVAGLVLSQATNNSGLPEDLRVFFGDGVFLIAAWVGIWYPLDTLIYVPAPFRRDRRVLQALLDVDVRVRAA
jgi:hypothetical protein